MHSVLRTALLAIFSAAACCAFQTAPLTRGGGLALRGLRLVQYRSTTDDKPRQDINQIFIAPTSQLPSAPVSSLPINYDEGLFNVDAPPQEFQIVPDTAVLLEPTSLPPANPTRGLAVLAIILGFLSIAERIPGSHSVAAHFCGGGMGGIAQLCVSRQGEALVNGDLSEKVATHGMVKGVSAGCYSAFFMSARSASRSLAGLAGVALASLGTGLIIGMFYKAVERANAVGEGTPLLTRFQTKASHGFFTQDGVFGDSSLLLKDLVNCVVQYEAFYLAWAALCVAYPWMGITFAGNAVSGALAGVTSLAVGASFGCLTNLSEFSRKCAEWRSEKVTQT
eukprot:3854806-Rhodomonas_salina.1